MDLLPNMRKEVTRIFTIVTSMGVDPVTAMEQASKVVTLNEYRDMLLGYASTVRTGGDVVHYLFNQTDLMFKGVSVRIKSLGEKMGMIMEGFLSVSVLGALGLFLMFVVGLSLPMAGVALSPDLFFFFSFIGLPLMSVVFIYMADAMQISYPVSNWKTYIVFAVFLPIGFFLGTQMVLPFYDNRFLLFPPARDFIIFIRMLLNFAEGAEAAIGMAITLIAIALPGVVADYYYLGREKNMGEGITQFLRDLVETRKSGLSPERCIESLSSRNYKGFSKHLKMISLRLTWGFSAHQIYNEFRAKVRNWLALVNIYLLIDTLEVGGGTEESLETLAGFSESMKQLDDEKKTMLMPLVMVPYLGAALLTATTVMFIQFFSSMRGLGLSIPRVTLYRVLLTPLAVHNFMMGLVSGKIISGNVSAGFKHAIFLILIALAGIWVVSNLQFAPVIG